MSAKHYLETSGEALLKIVKVWNSVCQSKDSSTRYEDSCVEFNFISILNVSTSSLEDSQKDLNTCLYFENTTFVVSTVKI